MGHQYSLNEEELGKVLKLTDWAAERLAVTFPSIFFADGGIRLAIDGKTDESKRNMIYEYSYLGREDPEAGV
jgi:hypothetical protein